MSAKHTIGSMSNKPEVKKIFSLMENKERQKELISNWKSKKLKEKDTHDTKGRKRIEDDAKKINSLLDEGWTKDTILRDMVFYPTQNPTSFKEEKPIIEEKNKTKYHRIMRNLVELGILELKKIKGENYYKLSKNIGVYKRENLLHKLKEIPIEKITFENEIGYFCFPKEIIPEIEIKAKEIKKLWIKHNLQKIAERMPELLNEFKTKKEKGYAVGCVLKLFEQHIKIIFKEEPNEFSKELNKIYYGDKNYKKVKEEFENMCKIYQEVGSKMNEMIGDKERRMEIDNEIERRNKELDEKIKENYRRRTNGRYGDHYPPEIFYSENMPNEYKSEIEGVKFFNVLWEFMLKKGKITKKQFDARKQIQNFLDKINMTSKKIQEFKFLFEINQPLIVIDLGYY